MVIFSSRLFRDATLFTHQPYHATYHQKKLRSNNTISIKYWIISIKLFGSQPGFCFLSDLLPDFARTTAVFYGGQLHVDVLRGVALTHGFGSCVCQRRVRDALVLRHRMGSSGSVDGRLRYVEELFRRHLTVSR